MKKLIKEEKKFDIEEIYLPEGMTFDYLSDLFSKYTVNMPDECEIERVINNLSEYIPQKTKWYEKLYKNFKYSIERWNISLYSISPAYWIFTLCLYIFGFYIVYSNGVDPYITIMLISPLPFVLGILEVIKGREEGVLELEMSCRISNREMVFSKLTLAGIYNIILNTLLSIMLININENLDILKVTMVCLTPFTFVSAVSLYICSKTRGYYSCMACIFIWIAISFSISMSPKYINRFFSIDFFQYLLILISGVLLLIFSIKKFLKTNVLEKEVN